MKVGRPTTYNQELVDSICEQLALGLPIRTVCAGEGMPAISTLFKWIREHEIFSKQYATAKQEAADAMAEELLYIADTPQLGEEITIRANGDEEIKRSDMLGHRRLQVDSRKWLMAKMKPKKYGDRLDMSSESTVTHRYEDMNDEQLRAAIESRKDRISEND